MSLGLFIYQPKQDQAADSQAQQGQYGFFASEIDQPSRPRSVALPTVVLIALVVLVLSLVKPSLSVADSKTTSAYPDTCFQSSDHAKRIRCPLDIRPGLALNQARVLIDNSAGVSTAHCQLLNRSATGGQARGTSVTVNAGQHGWKSLDAVGSSFGDLRYIECSLPADASLEKIDLSMRPAPVAGVDTVRELLRDSRRRSRTSVLTSALR